MYVLIPSNARKTSNAIACFVKPATNDSIASPAIPLINTPSRWRTLISAVSTETTFQILTWTVYITYSSTLQKAHQYNHAIYDILYPQLKEKRRESIDRH